MGNKNKYKQVEAFLIEHAQGISSKELADLVNSEYGTQFTKEDMQGFKKARKITSGYSVKGHSDLFPSEVVEYITTHYIGVGYRQQIENLRREFGKEYTTQQIKAFYRHHKLNSGLTGHFQKGFTPVNKGKKVGSHPNSKATQFKKGERPHNILPIGSEVVRTDGYHQTKIAEPNVWKLTHLLNWENANGPIPEGNFIEFKDGDRGNTSLENLIMVTRAEHIEMNRNNSALRSSIPELTEIGAKIARVRVTARKRARKK